MFKWIKELFSVTPETPHIWKEIKRETLGSYIDYGMYAQDINTMYRIAIYEECLLTKEKRIREICSLFPEDYIFNTKSDLTQLASHD